MYIRIDYTDGKGNEYTNFYNLSHDLINREVQIMLAEWQNNKNYTLLNAELVQNPLTNW